jgi:LuxR family maltose regulon positive regulatory protein
MQLSTPLLKTKLYIPPVRPELVSRPHLVERLNEGFRRGCKLTLVSAPAGYGKTTLLSEWALHCEPLMRVAWVSLDEGDNDPVRFWAHVVAALQAVRADIAEIAYATFQSPHSPPIESALAGLLNQIADVPDPSVLVLDDYHVVSAPAIHDALSFLLENLPPQVHLVISTRADPPLPIPRLRGRGQLTELYQSDLRFTSKEAAELLNQVMGLGLSAEDVTALEKRTEGWIAGLQMAAVSMQGRDDIAEFVRAFTGSHRYILDYLGEEVLRRQPEGVQRFLLQTAILDRLTGPLCDAVVGIDESADLQADEPPVRLFAGSQDTLEYLERNNLFVVPLDDERRWYRYHHLFADFLRQRLHHEERDLLPELHRRASKWYEEHRLTAQAVSHALAAGDLERAACLVEWVAWWVLARGEMTTLLGWLDTLPGELVRSRPQLGILRVWALAFTGRFDDAESGLSNVGVRHVQGEAAAVRAYIAGVRGDVPRTIKLAHQALEQLPEEKLFLRSIVAISLGIAYWGNNDSAAANRALSEAIMLGRAAGQTELTLAATATLGHVQEAQGLLRQAVETHREALELTVEAGSRPVPFAGIACVGMAEPLYEWNDLDGAMHHAVEGIRLCEIGGFVSYLLAGYANLAQVYQARGDAESALETIQKAERLAQRHEYAYVRGMIARLRVRLWVAQGNLAAASRWAQGHRLSPVDELDPAREIEQIAVVRVLIAQAVFQGLAPASEVDEALRLLARLLEAAEQARRMGSAIEILALQALAFQIKGDGYRALSALERALALGEPEGYVRTFVDEGEPMAMLLRLALSQGIAPNYVARLLAAFGKEAEPTPPTIESLVEPLSDRELQVLRLVVAGLSNPEIAQELVIAVSTVKSHVNHIYGKLGVESRTQAVVKAQELALL